MRLPARSLARQLTARRARGLRRGIAVTLLALAALAPAPAQEEPLSAPGARGEVTVAVVEVPVEVHRGDEPVRGLTAADFEVYEDGRRLPVVGFEAVDLGTAGVAATPSPAGRRHVLFFFDLVFSSQQAALRSVEAAQPVARTGLHPSDRVGVALYTPRGELPVLLHFTADHAAAVQTLASLERVLRGDDPAAVSGEGAVDPLRLTGLSPGELRIQARILAAENFPWEILETIDPSGRGGALQADAIASMGAVAEPALQEWRRSHARDLGKGLDELSQMLVGVDGRKQLYYFSEGFDLGLNEPRAVTRGRLHGGAASAGVSSLVQTFAMVVTEMRRNGWTIDAVDAAGLRRNDYQAGPMGTAPVPDGLYYLAQQTGGVLVQNDNDLARGVVRALDRHAVSYVLAVQVGDVAADGRFHPLEVRVPGARRGTRVEHRSGYYAPLPLAQQSEARRMADAAQRLASDEQRDDLGVVVAALPLPSAGTHRRVPVLVEVPGARLLAEAGPHQAVEIYGYAFDAAGGGSDFFATAVELDQERVTERLGEGGIRYLGELTVPAGPHRLRVLVRSRPSGRSSLLTLSLAAADAPAATAPPLFLPPADDPWILARQEGADLTLHGRSLQPALRGVVAAGGAANVMVLGEGLTEPGTALAGVVLGAAGKPAAAGLELLSLSPGGPGEPDLVMGRLRAEHLPPGPYVLELRRSDRRGVTVSRGPFEVGAVAPEQPQ